MMPGTAVGTASRTGIGTPRDAARDGEPHHAVRSRLFDVTLFHEDAR